MSTTTEDRVKQTTSQFDQRVAIDYQVPAAGDGTPRWGQRKQLDQHVANDAQALVSEGESPLRELTLLAHECFHIEQPLLYDESERDSCQLLRQAMSTAFTSSSTSGAGGVTVPELAPSSAALVLATPA